MSDWYAVLQTISPRCVVRMVPGVYEYVNESSGIVCVAGSNKLGGWCMK